MATIQIAIWVDSDGNARVEADDCEAFDNTDTSLAVRKVILSVEVPEPQAEQVEVEVPAEKPGEARVTVGERRDPDVPVAVEAAAAQPVAKRGWLR